MSMSSSQGSSYSTSTPIQTPENDIINAISGVASNIASQMYSWAQQEYAKTSAITDQTVGNFLAVSNKMTGFAGGMIDQYNNLFAPENAQLIKDANSYASEDRMRADMGMAGATAAQAGKQALDNATANLQSYGIDPSSGRYAALDKAAAVQNAANISGAENMQRVSDITTGQNLRQSAVNAGAQLPGAISNAENTAIQANTGAINASLANFNSGVNAFRLPNDYLQTAMQVKLPPMGNRSSSQNSSQSSGPGNGGGGGGSGGGHGGGSGGGGDGPAWMPQHGGGGTNGPALSSYNFGGPQISSGGDDYSAWNPFTDGGVTADQFTGGNDYSGYDLGYGDIGQQSNDSFDYGSGSQYYGGDGFGQNYDYGGDTQGYGGYNGTDSDPWGLNNFYDPSANQTSDYSGYGDYSTPSSNTNWGDSGGGSTDYSGWGDYSTPSQDTNWDSGNAGYDDYGAGGYFADGGAIPSGPSRQSAPRGPTTGGQVPRAASPSQGRKTDDVPANLNAGEFVVPRDVVQFKGHQFFQKLIADARKNRVSHGSRQAPVQGRSKPGYNPALSQRPTFTSQPMR